MQALKILLGLCAGIACVLVVLTLFIAIGFVIRIIAVMVAVVGVLWIMGALIWLAINELWLDRKKKAPK